MNPQPDQDLERRFQELEAEVNYPPQPQPPEVFQPQTPIQPQLNNFPSVQINSFVNWFNGLSGLGKLIVVGVGAIVSLAILRVVLKLVSAVISLAVLAVLLYFGYQFFVARSSENKS